MRRPLLIATLALTVVTVFGLAMVGVWSGDHRWWDTAALVASFVGLPALGAVLLSLD